MFNNTKSTNSIHQTLHCAIYTRKSHEEGLEQEFNSLDAQREAGEAYIESQRMQGWITLPDRYDDGGYSGGTMDRPALQKLLTDIDAGKVDIIVVYKIDRLSRSLLDFMKMVELFNEKEVSFVSVTQHFSTTDPTGRMFLGILITFAQYEREVIAERIRDKVAAAKRRGKYCGGPAILGYDVDRESKKLIANKTEAKLVRFIFRRYSQVGSAKKVAQEINQQGYRTKAWTTKKGKKRPGLEWTTGHIYRILNKRLYIAEIAYKGENYPAEHEALIDIDLWDKVQTLLSENKRDKQSIAKVKMVSPLKGVLRCGHCDCSMGITYSQKKDRRRYSYYICEKDAKRAFSKCPLKRVPAGDIEKAVLTQLAAVFRTPKLVAKTYFIAKEIEDEERHRLHNQKEQLERQLNNVRQEALELMAKAENSKRNHKLYLVNQHSVDLTMQLTNVSARLKAIETGEITEHDVSEAFQNVEFFWKDLFPIERNRLVQLLVDNIKLWETGIDIELKTNGLTSLITELAGIACEVNERSNS